MWEVGGKGGDWERGDGVWEVSGVWEKRWVGRGGGWERGRIKQNRVECGEVWWVCRWGQVFARASGHNITRLFPTLPTSFFFLPPSSFPFSFFLAFVLSSSPLLSSFLSSLPLSSLFSLHPSSLLSISPLLPPLLAPLSSLLQESEIVVHTTSSTATRDHTDNTTSSSSSSSSSSAPLAGSHYLSSQLLSEKTKLARKIREYNRKTTPVNHIHIKSASSSVGGGRGRGE